VSGKAGTDEESPVLTGARNVEGGAIAHPAVQAAFPDERQT
jgi:hypothetical protein